MDVEIQPAEFHFARAGEDEPHHLAAQSGIPVTSLADVTPVFGLVFGDMLEAQRADGHAFVRHAPDPVIRYVREPGEPAPLLSAREIRRHGEPFDFRIAEPYPGPLQKMLIKPPEEQADRHNRLGSRI